MLFVIVFVTDYTLLTSGISLCDKKSEKKLWIVQFFSLRVSFFRWKCRRSVFSILRIEFAARSTELSILKIEFAVWSTDFSILKVAFAVRSTGFSILKVVFVMRSTDFLKLRKQYSYVSMGSELSLCS